MKVSGKYLLAALLVLTSGAGLAQVPVTAQANHDTLLSSSDSKEARNKRLVYDFWREVVEAGHVESIDKYVGENYIQHNPNVATGRAALVEQIAKSVKKQPPLVRVRAPIVSMVAEGNYVVVSLVSEIPDVRDPQKRYTTTWFDMFRIEDGKIVEHWDSAQKLQ